MASERKMTPKGFLHKTTTKAANSAAAFLATYRQWLETGELATLVSPILRKLDDKELLPTPALKAVAYAVMAHIIETDRRKAEDAIEAAGQSSAAPKPWQAIIYGQVKDIETGQMVYAIATKTNSDGEEEDLVKSFDHPQEADRWVDRRLFDGASDWYGEIEGLGTHVRVERADAMARILKKAKGPAVHQKAVTTKTLGFGVRAKQDRASFSRG